MTLFTLALNLGVILGGQFLANKFLTMKPKTKAVVNNVVAAATAAYTLKALNIVDILALLQGIVNSPAVGA